ISEGGVALRPEDRVEFARLWGKQPVGGARREDDRVEIGGREPVPPEQLLGRGLRHAGIRLVRLRHPPLANARPLHDPLVRGVEALRELLVRHCALGRIAARAPELHDRTLHRTAPPSANSASISCSRWLSTICAATRTAFLMARGGEAPWQMITTPLT